MTDISAWIIANIDDDMRDENARKSAYVREVMKQYRPVPVQLVIEGDHPKPLDPAVTARLNQAWDQ